MADPSNFTIGWICAKVIEYVASKECLDETYSRSEQPVANNHPAAGNDYTLGRIGPHKVVITVLNENGISAATAGAHNIWQLFPNIRFCLMVGIGGGVPYPTNKPDIRLGDVVVSEPTYDHKGNTYGGVVHYNPSETVRKGRLESVKYMNKPPSALRGAIHGLKSEHMSKGHKINDIINQVLRDAPRVRKYLEKPNRDTDIIYDCHHGRTPRVRPERTTEDNNPEVHYGLIASADYFMNDVKTRDLLRDRVRVLCFEMEAAGLLSDFPCVVIRGISDYCDGEADDTWYGYASLTAAAYAKELLGHLQPQQVEAEKRLNECLSG